MTVKEYIEYLKTLDQDKGIWVSYDFPHDVYPPTQEVGEADEDYVKYFGENGTEEKLGVKEGDYLIIADI